MSGQTRRAQAPTGEGSMFTLEMRTARVAEAAPGPGPARDSAASRSPASAPRSAATSSSARRRLHP